MEKVDVVAALGQSKLLLPARIKSALAANDRLKFALTALQAAAAHAADGSAPLADLRRDYAAAHTNAPWMLEMQEAAWSEGGKLHLPDLPRLGKLLGDDIRLMARPLEGSADAAHLALLARVGHWCDWLDRLNAGVLDDAQMVALTGGRRGEDDTIHILVMDLHKSLNRMAADMSDDTVDGAHVWQLEAGDRPRVAAFMRGLNRTRKLKFDHPGLDTAATRDGARLLIQNDIGTNDAHVLVIQMEGLSITLIYSDLHERRFAFFQELLVEIGAQWSGVGARRSVGLNAGADYVVGTARFDCADTVAADAVLEGLGARIVFLIDWNRARKRLNRLVAKPLSVAVLTEAAHREAGHMGWLMAGAEQLVFDAMEALSPDHFRVGDRLDGVLGEAEARDFLTEALLLSSNAMQAGQTAALVADQIRLLLSRHVGRHRDEFALLGEHAAFCQALAEGVRDALAHGHETDVKAARKLSERAKVWERKADHLVMRLRDQAAGNARWLPFLRLIECADDAADELEEAVFVLSLIAEHDHHGWNEELRAALRRLADKVLDAAQDHVKALAVARTLNEASLAEDQDEFLAACWRVVNAEKLCDALTRDVRRLFVRHVSDAAALSLGTDFAAALEASTDALLRTGYAMRGLVFTRVGADHQGRRA
ncbi:MAG: DUF47 family protein [Mesorhizobium sp.]|uniref:DUF47 family protein n=1 Tax=Mesorhizobium sp. TaxID=1871066 RepID=UPI000FE583F5|nr:DUF47 family protein [Mesorhizobium sp.]RWL82163.1 MAG: DUF47 family protein [Mesorhizobium sp.]RWL87431.1 MAG: DUF47 family protein [Mesorhizobium sp.]RWL98771.1 MAG: DUF47 family protein [Mesorhizobium sp.]TIP02726.1 MAG: DUF47 family protein [Mesorhizobium sp.]